MMKRLLCLPVIVLALLVSPVMAQDVTPEPDAPPVVVSDPPAIPPVEDAATMLLVMFTALLAGAARMPVTVSVVSVLKRLPPLKDVSGEVITFGVAAVITVITWVSQRYGYEGQVKAGLDFLQTLIPALGLLVGNLVISSATYKAAKATDTPVLGYARS